MAWLAAALGLATVPKCVAFLVPVALPQGRGDLQTPPSS